MAGSDDTIFALSSAPGRAGVAVIRVSGRDAATVMCALSGRDKPKAREAALRILRSPEDGAELDRGLVLWFPSPQSFTGEDVVEFHVHGGRAVVNALLDVIGRFGHCRLAEPGEFARRAFDNEKIGLVEAEALADLIAAETEAQRRQALMLSGQKLQDLYDTWRTRLLNVLALVEAAIDFSDEADVADNAVSQAEVLASVLKREIEVHLDDGRRGEIVRDGFRIVLAGAPNAGKSSLLNVLARRDAAIVSAEAGTTRDVIEVALDLDGLPIIVSDTAGIRDAPGEIEREGMRRARDAGRRADLVIWLIDAAAPGEQCVHDFADESVPVLRVLNKIDLEVDTSCVPRDLDISVRSSEGLQRLEQEIVSAARLRIGDQVSPALTRHRHREALEVTREGLKRFSAAAPAGIEVRAEELRTAASALGKLTGRVDVEEVLGQIFSEFCIGK